MQADLSADLTESNLPVSLHRILDQDLLLFYLVQVRSPVAYLYREAPRRESAKTFNKWLVQASCSANCLLNVTPHEGAKNSARAICSSRPRSLTKATRQDLYVTTSFPIQSQHTSLIPNNSHKAQVCGLETMNNRFSSAMIK